MSRFTVGHIVERRTRVVVCAVSDDAANSGRLGHRGKIVGADMTHLGTPDDPYWDVAFADHKRDRFWGEELALATEDVEANHAAEGGRQ